MKRILVIGCPGAGKSTFARKLRDITGIPLFYLDMLWHKSDGSNVSCDIFDNALKEILEKETWIIDGNYGRTMELRLRYCDTVFFLDIPVADCLSGAASRIGMPREDMPWIEREVDEEFRREITAFPLTQLPEIMKLLKRYEKQAEITVFHSRDEIDCWVRQRENANKRKYYEAYEDRYLQIHRMGLQWSEKERSPIVEKMIKKYGFENSRILEVGCGEGRDAAYLLKRGYRVHATDLSQEAIFYCREHIPDYCRCFSVLDCLNGDISDSFDFIYAVAVLHMLVEDDDRKRFYQFISHHLTTGGKALICTMGDGTQEFKTDPREAFLLKTRIHQSSGTEVRIAATSCRVVSECSFRDEILSSGLTMDELGYAEDTPGFPIMLYAVVSND